MSTTTPEFREFRDDLIRQCFATGKATRGKNRNEITVMVAGVTFQQRPLRRIIDEGYSDTDVTLIRDVGNEHSPAAIAVEHEYGCVGWIPDPVARILAPHLDGGRLGIESVWCRVWEMDEVDDEETGEPAVALTLEFGLYPWEDELSPGATDTARTGPLNC